MNRVGAALLFLCASSVCASTAAAPDCAATASDACYFAFEPAGGGGRLHYYASRVLGAASVESPPTQALIALHGHSRDANKTFDAAWSAVQRGGAAATTLVVAPVFQVDATQDGKCRTAGVPAAQNGDLLWTCASWPAGAPARNGNAPTSFAAMDALVAELLQRWPGLRFVTIAGFSAGAQLVQHYIGFAATPAAEVTVRYVVADPGTWLYFDPVRPQPIRDGRAVDWTACTGGADGLGGCSFRFADPSDACLATHHWKYGTAGVPATLGRSAAEAKARYADADIHYLEGDRDSSDARGTAFRVLDRSCAANAQGPYRLQRGLAYAQYDRSHLTTTRPHPLTVVPGCAHDVACVFPSEAARAALFGPSQ